MGGSDAGAASWKTQDMLASQRGSWDAARVCLISAVLRGYSGKS